MGWHCRLYGHRWRHDGEHEVVRPEENGPVYPFECAVCGREKVVNVGRNEWVPARTLHG